MLENIKNRGFLKSDGGILMTTNDGFGLPPNLGVTQDQKVSGEFLRHPPVGGGGTIQHS
ncbi:hypothetical protein IID24_03435 [Patescibacteria group bacterium]|nr:hypothetical protein [Patescibacteria group bacterium]